MSHDYPSPRPENAAFTEYWEMYLEDIGHRENLKKSHLQQLKVLCDISVEYDELQEMLILEGRTYESIGRNGLQIKLRPEVLQLNKILAEIRNYSKMLGLILFKDTATKEEEEEDEFA